MLICESHHTFYRREPDFGREIERRLSQFPISSDIDFCEIGTLPAIGWASPIKAIDVRCGPVFSYWLPENRSIAGP